MILGTVELGMAYGINNTHGKPSLEKSFCVLNSAWEGGIRELDTASAYGDSEKIIGMFQSERNISFKIDTKLPVNLEIFKQQQTTTNNNKQQQTTTNNNKQQQTTTNNNKQQQTTTNNNKQQQTTTNNNKQ